jgi:outer membrane protein assembly factor BamB
VLGATGIFRCLNGADGTELWRHDLVTEFGGRTEDDGNGIAWGRSGSPLIVNQLVIVPVGGPDRGEKVSLVAYDKATGKEVWRAGQFQISYASPVHATICGVPQVMCVLEEYVCSFDLDDGSMLWKHAWPGGSTSAANASQAVPLDGDRVFLSKGYWQGAELLRISLDEQTGWSVSSLWREPRVMRTKFSNVAVLGNYAYGLDDIVVECIDLRTGKAKWKSRRYGYGQVLRVGTDLLVQSEDGRIALVRASPDRHTQLGRFEALSGKAWNVPCVYGRYLLVRSDQEAACYELALLSSP